jgi:hypothetical protein
MSISASEVVENKVQADGSRQIGFRYTFHTGEVVDRRFLAPSDYNATTGISDMASDVEQYMIDREDENLISTSTDPVNDIPVHPETDTPTQRQRRWLRKLIRFAMRNREKEIVYRLLYPIWYEFKFNLSYTPTQIQNYFDITVAQYTTFNDRLTLYHNHKDLMDLDESYIEEMD